MKRILPFLLVAVVALVSVSVAQQTGLGPAKELMREKLELSQKLLEGLATENYDLMLAKSARLSAISQGSGWSQFDNPEYAPQSVIFRRQVEALNRAARNKNLDAATLAYVRMTMSCVDCHKLIRGKPSAGLQRTIPGA
jgi:hypothetical protein